MSNGYVIPVDPAELASRFGSTYDPNDEEADYLDPDREAENVPDDAVAEFFADNDYESRIQPLLDRIPEREADLIYLYFIQRKRQLDIATIFGITQAAVSYRLERGLQRIRFLLSIPQVTEEELRADLPHVFPMELPCPLCCPTKAKAAWADAGELAEGEGEGPKSAPKSKPGKSKKAPPPPPAANPNQPCRVCVGSRAILIDVAILVGMWKTTCQSEVATMLNLTQGRVRHRFFRAVERLEKAADQDERFRPYSSIFSAISNKNFNILREVELPQWADRGGDAVG
jgi:DNA-directed RNA polymerase specialized sigma24 family protein